MAGLSVEVPRGSVTGFIGPKGAGKTTTMAMVLGRWTTTMWLALPWAALFFYLLGEARRVDSGPSGNAIPAPRPAPFSP